VLNINQGNHTVSKSNSYSDKDDDGIDFGIDDLFSFGGSSSSQSSSSASFSELHEWLLLHHYDVEIQGAIFVPKNLTLKRLNLGVLTHQQTIYTKSVQMHHVDAPGTLRITVGAASPVESEDFKSLRTRLDNLEPQTAQLNGRVGQLEPLTAQLKNRIDTIEPELANATVQSGQLNARIDQVASGLSGSIGTKLSSCSFCLLDVRGLNGGVNTCYPASQLPGLPYLTTGAYGKFAIGGYMNVQCHP